LSFYPSARRRQKEDILDQEWDNPVDFNEKYGKSNSEAFATHVAGSSYFDEVGVLLRKDLVEIGMVNDLIGNSIIDVWDKIGIHFLEIRNRNSNPHAHFPC